MWKKLKELANIDKERKKITAQIEQVRQRIAEDNKVIPELTASIAALKQEAINAKKHVDSQELNAEHLQNQEQKLRNKLAVTFKPKECQALESELKVMLQESSEQDDALVNAWHELELAEQKKVKETKNIQEKIVLLQNDITQTQSSITGLQEQQQTVEEKRAKHAATLPSEWLTRYERMSAKVSDPFVPLINTSCSSCYYIVPPQDLARLQRNAILPCRSCYRFLYYDQEEVADIQSESF